MSLLLKKDRDPLDCGSYRPISSLNNDVKILAKVLAHRLEDILPSLIYPDRTGFIKKKTKPWQGLPFKLLFAIAIEQLPTAIRSNGHIQGIWRGGVEHKVLLLYMQTIYFCWSQKHFIIRSPHCIGAFQSVCGK